MQVTCQATLRGNQADVLKPTPLFLQGKIESYALTREETQAGDVFGDDVPYRLKKLQYEL